MPGREREIWFDKLGIAGIRRDILQEKSDETVLFECHNLDPFSVQGSILKIPGRGDSVMAAIAYTSSSTFAPAIRTVSLVNMAGDNYVVGVGAQGGEPTRLCMYMEELPAGGVSNPVCLFECAHPEYLSPPVGYAGGVVTPRGEDALPVITSYIDIEVDDTTLDDELDFAGPVHRDGKTGFPFAGFVHHNGVNNNANWFPPFATQMDAAADRFDNVVVIETVNRTQPGATGFGCVGTATYGPLTDDILASDALVEFPNYPGSDGVWQYGYSQAGDTGAFGWGYKHGSGSSAYRWILRWAALGYVYVYADGTTSEMFVMRWQNKFTDYSDPSLGGPANNGAPISINQVVAGAGTPFGGNVNLCVIAWKVRCRVPATLLSDHNVVGVRVFYSHRSHKQGAYTTYDDGYNGWTNDQDIFSNMREVMYVDEDDAKVGYCRVESAEYASISGETDGATLQCAYFNYVLCPCELSVAQYAEVIDAMPDQSVKTPMALGRKWGEIRGDIDSETGVLADMSAGRVTVQVIENGQVVKTYAPDSSSDGGTAFTTRSNTLVNHVSFVQPQTAVRAYGAFQQVGRLFYWGVLVPGERKVDWLTIYPTHIDQDSIAHPSIVRMDLQVPIRLGEIRAAQPIGRDAVIGTTAGIALMSFGSGQAGEWSRRTLDSDVSVQTPGMMRTVGGVCYIVGVDGHLYAYVDGATELTQITSSLSSGGDYIVIPRFVGDGESYPTDFVFNDVAISYAPQDERLVVCYRYNWRRVLTLCYDIRARTFLTMSRYFVGAANTMGNIPYITTGSTVVGLWDRANDYVEGGDSGFGSAIVGGTGDTKNPGTNEQITEYTITDGDIWDLSGGSAAWVDKGKAMVGWSAFRIAQAVAGLPPGGTLFYRSFGWRNIDGYTIEYTAPPNKTGQFLFDDPLYDAGGKITVVPDLFWYSKNGGAESISTAMAWKLSFEKFITSPGRQHLISMVMLKGTIQDTFTVKFYPDGSSTAHTTVTVSGVVNEKRLRVRVPARHSVRIVMESSSVDIDGTFELRRFGLVVREGGRLG